MSVSLLDFEEIAILGSWLRSDNRRHGYDYLSEQDMVVALAETNMSAYQERYAGSLEPTMQEQFTKSYAENYTKGCVSAIETTKPLTKKILPIEILQFTEMYEYQVNGSTGYANSEAKKICDYIKYDSIQAISNSMYKQLKSIQDFTPLRYYNFNVLKQRTMPLPIMSIGANLKKVSKDDQSEINNNEIHGR